MAEVAGTLGGISERELASNFVGFVLEISTHMRRANSIQAKDQDIIPHLRFSLATLIYPI